MLCNEIPVIFRREIYATLCIVGGTVFFVLRNNFHIETEALYAIVSALIITLRLMAVKFRWYLAPLDREG